MMIMEYTNGVVKTDKVQTVKLTLQSTNLDYMSYVK